jgi:preprotein translocase subunit SecE
MSDKKNEKVDLELEEELTVTPKVPAKTEKTDKQKKGKSDGKKSKPGLLTRLSRWWREMKSELKKVQWPGKKQTLNNTWVVLLSVIIVGFFIWAFDFLAKGIINALLALFKG